MMYCSEGLKCWLVEGAGKPCFGIICFACKDEKEELMAPKKCGSRKRSRRGGY